MDYVLNATDVAIEDDDKVLSICFFDSRIEPFKYVQLQKSWCADEQDKALHQDTSYLEVDDQSRAMYGAIASMSSGDCSLRIALHPEAQEKLRVGGEIKITLLCTKEVADLAFQKISMASAHEFDFQNS